MLFNSLAFLKFFFLVLLSYVLLRKNLRAQNLLLLVASYGFYGAWDYRFLVLIWASTLVDFVVGRKLHQSSDPAERKRWLVFSLLSNLGTLGFFKYFNFFSENLGRLLGIPADSVTLSIVLPVGISFYTFQSLSYTVDIYRKELEPCSSALDFALYVAFFPQLVAGPIERAGRLLAQIQSPRSPRAIDVEIGIYLLLWGYYKKVVIADNLAKIADPVFANGSQAQGMDVWLGLLAFCFQIYCDFSGYSSIARGLARLMGFQLVRNFRLPYSALTPSEFWQRWHISLSQWLRDYLYIPLGGNRGGSKQTYRNLTITMVLGGLWHGAAWNFCLWGAYHGLLLCLYRLGKVKPSENGVKRLFQWGLMSMLTLYGWLLFRASSLAEVARLSGGLLSLQVTEPTLRNACDLLFYITPLILIEIYLHKKGDLLAIPRSGILPLACFQVFCLASILVLRNPGAAQFLYFQF